jgi:transposase
MNWLYKAWSSGIKFAETIAGYRFGILNYFDHSITIGIVEVINNKIKVLILWAHGFSDMDYFKLRIYDLNESKYALVG